MIYWLALLWRNPTIDKSVKVDYTFGLIIAPFIYAPVIAFKFS